MAKKNKSMSEKARLSVDLKKCARDRDFEGLPQKLKPLKNFNGPRSLKCDHDLDLIKSLTSQKVKKRPLDI